MRYIVPIFVLHWVVQVGYGDDAASDVVSQDWPKGRTVVVTLGKCSKTIG